MNKIFFILLSISLLLSLSSCNIITNTQPIHKASSKGDIAKAIKIIEKDPTQVNVQDNLGMTPLYLASMKGHKEIVEFLIKSGADIELGNDLEERPLAKAAKFGHYEVVKMRAPHLLYVYRSLKHNTQLR